MPNLRRDGAFQAEVARRLGLALADARSATTRAIRRILEEVFMIRDEFLYFNQRLLVEMIRIMDYEPEEDGLQIIMNKTGEAVLLQSFYK